MHITQLTSTFPIFYTRKITAFSKSRLLAQNSVFFKKFRIFQKIPVRKKLDLFKKSTFDTKFRVFQKIPHFSKIPRSKKSRLFQQNMIHRHKHLFFPNALSCCKFLTFSTSLFGTFVILYPAQLQNPAEYMLLIVLFQRST